MCPLSTRNTRMERSTPQQDDLPVERILENEYIHNGNSIDALSSPSGHRRVKLDDAFATHRRGQPCPPSPCSIARRSYPHLRMPSSRSCAKRAPRRSCARGVGPEDAEDIAQDCMERLIRYRAQGPDELRLLLYRIARNRLADRGRSPLSRPHLPLADDGGDEPSSSSPDPLRQASQGRCCPCCGRPCSSCPNAHARSICSTASPA